VLSHGSAWWCDVVANFPATGPGCQTRIAGCERIYAEKRSGADGERKELGKLMRSARPSDTRWCVGSTGWPGAPVISATCLTGWARIFKLAEAAERNWHRLNGHNQLPKIILGITFSDGIEVVRSQAQTAAA
jgi:hypothetical protein